MSEVYHIRWRVDQIASVGPRVCGLDLLSASLSELGNVCVHPSQPPSGRDQIRCSFSSLLCTGSRRIWLLEVQIKAIEKDDVPPL